MKKCHIKTHASILMHFLDKMVNLFFLKIEVLRSASVQYQGIISIFCYKYCFSYEKNLLDHILGNQYVKN